MSNYDGGVSRAELDPTGTTTIRRRYGERLRGRWSALRGAIRRAVVDRDVFGVNADGYGLAAGRPSGSAVALAEWEDFEDYEEPEELQRILEDRREAAVDHFMTWLETQIERGVLKVIHRGENPYIRAAYRQGANKILKEFGAPGEAVLPSQEDSTPVQIGGPYRQRTLQRLYSRNFENLKGITDDTAQVIREELTEGLIKGVDVDTLGQRINKRIGTEGEYRSTVLARTETIYAHSEATVNEWENLQGEGIVSKSEFAATDDHRTCPLCKQTDGKVYRVDDIRSATFEYVAGEDEPDSLTGTYPVMPPVHPQCRCTLLPLVAGGSAEAHAAEPETFEPRHATA